MRNAINNLVEAETDGNLLLKSVKVSADVRGAMFEAKVTQSFTNPTATHVEAIYVFPLPIDATLLNVEVVMGEKRLTGLVAEKRAVNAKYEKTLSDGDAAILLERSNDGNYVLSLGNLAPGEDCQVEIRYAHMLNFEQNSLRLRIPTVIAPRYGNLEIDGGLLPHQVPGSDFLAEYEFMLEVRLHDRLSGCRLASPSHLISIQPAREGSPSVTTVTLASKSLLDRDFVLVIDQLLSQSLMTVLPDLNDKDKYAVIASFCPSFTQSAKLPVNLKILVDCSGSMNGDNIRAARGALHEILASLDPNDNFSLSKFGSHVEHRSRALWVANDRTVASAAQWVDELQADMGGTNMADAVASTCELTSEKDNGCDVLLITDGAISAVNDIIETARQSKHRIFVVAIGSSPVGNFLQDLSRATGGACEYVAGAEKAESAIIRMFNRLRSVSFSELSITWPNAVVPLWSSSFEVSVFSDDTVHVYGWIPRDLFVHADGIDLRLQGNVGAERAELGRASFDVSREIQPPGLQFSVARLVAAKCIEQATDIQKQVKLAVDYQLVTDNTSLLIVNKRTEDQKAKEMPNLIRVNQMTPAGQSGLGTEYVCLQRVVFTEELAEVEVHSVNAACRSIRLPSALDSSQYDHSLDVPSFLRQTPRDESIPRVRPALPDKSVIKLLDNALFARNFNHGQYHYAFIEKQVFTNSVTVWFFTVKRKGLLLTVRAVVFDCLEFGNDELALRFLAANDFHEFTRNNVPGLEKIPDRMHLDKKEMETVY